MANLLNEIYKTKLQLIAVVAGVVGIALMMLAKWPPLVMWLETLPLPVPLGELGSAVFATGLLGVMFEYVDRKHGDMRTEQRLQRALREEAPAFRDVVLDSFAFDPERPQEHRLGRHPGPHCPKRPRTTASRPGPGW